MNSYFLVNIKTKSEGPESLPVASYVVDQAALIMITRLAEQSQAGILKQLLFPPKPEV